MTTFTDAVTAVVTARANHLAACRIVAAAETTHGVGSDEAHEAISGPQKSACDAELDAEEALAITPATTAQEALQKAYLLMDAAIPDRSIKAVKADLGRFVEASETANTNAQTPNQTLEEIASIAGGLDDLDSPVASIAAIIRLINQLAESQALDNGLIGFNNAMFWLSCQGLDALKELESLGNRIHHLASVDA